MKRKTFKQRKKLCIITTAPVSLYVLYRGFYPYAIAKGLKITALAGSGSEYHRLIQDQGVRSHVMPFVRKPSPLKDLWCFTKLWWFFLRNRFDIIHASTPKAMLLGMLAAFLSGHSFRVITVRGRAYENIIGFKKVIFVFLDQLTCKLAHRVIPICKELEDSLVNNGCASEKISFLGASSNGVDPDRYKKNSVNTACGKELRSNLGISLNAQVILSVGRVRKEKGINELVNAFSMLKPHTTGQELHLVLVGPYESIDPLDSNVQQLIDCQENIHAVGNQMNVVPWYAMADILAFPSYREGFGNVAIEAAAMELPVVASNIIGCREGVADGVTGYLVPPREIIPLATTMQLLVNNQVLREKMGKSGRKRVISDFEPKHIWDGILELYNI